MSAFLYDAMLLLLGAIVGLFLNRVIRWRKAQLQHETAMLATHALDDAQYVFNQAVASGGRLAHPWEHHGRTLHCDELQSRLRTSRSRIKDRTFRKAADNVITEIQNVWAAAHVIRATIAYPGMPKNPGDSAREQATQSKANAQLRHARAGLEVACKARVRLGKLETHT